MQSRDGEAGMTIIRVVAKLSRHPVIPWARRKLAPRGIVNKRFTLGNPHLSITTVLVYPEFIRTIHTRAWCGD